MDLINLEILSPQYMQDRNKLREIFGREDTLERYKLGHCFSEYFHSYRVSENNVSHKSNSCNVHDLSQDSLNFLLSLNHKKIELDKINQDSFDFRKILRRHRNKKSIVLLNNQICISNTSSLCSNKLLNSISELLFSFPESGLKISYNNIMDEQIFDIIYKEKNKEMRINLYIEQIYKLKAKTSIGLNN